MPRKVRFGCLIGRWCTSCKLRRRLQSSRSACDDEPSDAMMVHFLDGTYELFRHYYGRRRFDQGKLVRFGAVTGVLHTVLEMIEKGATHLGVATDHVIES